MQTGKSCILSTVLPAVLRDDPFFGVGKDNEVAVMKLDLSNLPVEKVSIV